MYASLHRFTFGSTTRSRSSENAKTCPARHQSMIWPASKSWKRGTKDLSSWATPDSTVILVHPQIPSAKPTHRGCTEEIRLYSDKQERNSRINNLSALCVANTFDLNLNGTGGSVVANSRGQLFTERSDRRFMTSSWKDELGFLFSSL